MLVIGAGNHGLVVGYQLDDNRKLLTKGVFIFWWKELLTCLTHLDAYLDFTVSHDDGKY